MGKRRHGLKLELGSDPSLACERPKKKLAKRAKDEVTSKAAVIPNEDDVSSAATSKEPKVKSLTRPVGRVPTAVFLIKPARLETIPALLLDEMQSERAETVLRALQRLGGLCLKVPAFRVDAVQQGAHTLLLVAMKHKWKHHEAIVAACCKCLSFLTIPISKEACNHTLRLTLLVMGANKVLADAIRDFPYSVIVHEFGFGALRQLFDRNDPRTRYSAEQFCCVEGGISLITNGMKKFSQYKSLQYRGCILLFKLSAVFPTLTGLVEESEAICVVDLVMKRHSRCRCVQRQGKEFLEVMATYRGHRSQSQARARPLDPPGQDPEQRS